MPSVVDVVIIAGLAGVATGLGALPLFFTERISHRLYDGAIGFAGGIMIGAAVFALILPGLTLGSLWEVGLGVIVGGMFLLAMNALLPHLHMEFRGPRSEGATEETNALQRALLVGSAITIHNVPEGLAIGIAFASGEEAIALSLAVAIAIQNIPDGFAFAVPAVSAGVSKPRTLLYTTMSGGVPEPVAAALGFLLVLLITGIFPFAAGFAAGAMIAVVSREMIPASHGHGYADMATMSFVTGFVLMMCIDIVLAV